MQTLYGENFEKLASYIAKSETKQQAGAGGKSTYSCSRNLVEPLEKIKRVKATSWRDEPAIPKGWALDKGSLTVGINPFTGFGYQFYRLVQLE